MIFLARPNPTKISNDASEALCFQIEDIYIDISRNQHYLEVMGNQFLVLVENEVL